MGHELDRDPAFSLQNHLPEHGGPQRSGWGPLAVKTTEDGQQRVLYLKGRKTVRKGW